MNEKDWARQVHRRLHDVVQKMQSGGGVCLDVREGAKLAYSLDITNYTDYTKEEPRIQSSAYETDLLVIETNLKTNTWKPRVVIELKLGEPHTHDAITYSRKASAHKSIHPYLRYGILIGSVKSLSWRFYRHGECFDFMTTWSSTKPNQQELATFTKLVRSELKASRQMEMLFSEKGNKDHRRYTYYHRKLELR
jgi:hypothetical protein